MSDTLAALAAPKNNRLTLDRGNTLQHEITILGKPYKTTDKAFDVLRGKSIKTQIEALQDLGRYARQGDKHAKSLIKEIAENEDIDTIYKPAVQSYAKTMIDIIDIPTSKGFSSSEPVSISTGKTKDDDDEDEDDTPPIRR